MLLLIFLAFAFYLSSLLKLERNTNSINRGTQTKISITPVPSNLFQTQPQSPTPTTKSIRKSIINPGEGNGLDN